MKPICLALLRTCEEVISSAEAICLPLRLGLTKKRGPALRILAEW